MEFSKHYSPFLEKTLIVLTNNEKARLLSAFGHEVDELSTVSIKSPELDDFAAQKAAQLAALGKKLSVAMEKLLKTDFTAILLCVPEVNREQLLAAMSPSLVEKCTTIIPKNLSAMELPVVMRIILER